MSLYPKEKLELVKSEFSRTREAINQVYHSQVEYIQNGLRGTSDKQFNLNLSLISIAVVMIGVVIPITLQADASINHWYLRFSMYSFIASFVIGLVVNFFSIYKDRGDLKKIADTQQNSLGNILDLIKLVLVKANNETLTTEDIDEYNQNTTKESKQFAENSKPQSQKLLDSSYYLFLAIFMSGLVCFIIAILPLLNRA